MKEIFHEVNTVDSYENLKRRVLRMLKIPTNRSEQRTQLSFNLPVISGYEKDFGSPANCVSEFLDLFSSALPDGNVYIFGGLLRDMALYGKKGFNSDIDLVAEGSWGHCVDFLEYCGASKNKFGGYRLKVGDWPIDIWNARETWAIKCGLVKYLGIQSLTKTTMLNWDAILMNWRTKNFISCEDYLDAVKERKLDIVLEKNPNPLGMAVRVFRHLCLKDPKKISPSAAIYLANCTSQYSFNKLRNSEFCSYGNTVMEQAIYKFFERIKQHENLGIEKRFNIARDSLLQEGIALSGKQSEWNFNDRLECNRI